MNRKQFDGSDTTLHMAVQSLGQKRFTGARVTIRNEACSRDVCHTHRMVTSFYSLLASHHLPFTGGLTYVKLKLTVTFQNVGTNSLAV